MPCMQAYGHTMDFTKMVHLLRASWDAPKTAHPNLLTYNAAISVCCRVGQLGRGMRLLHEMVGFPSSSLFRSKLGSVVSKGSAGLWVLMNLH